MKKILTLLTMLLLFSVFFASPFGASNHDGHDHKATEHANTDEGEILNTFTTEEGEFGVLYVPCPAGGKHTVGPRGYGEVFVNGVEVFNGPASQCSKCYLAVITEFNPFSPYITALGKYAIREYSRPLGSNTKMATSSVRTNTYKTNAPFDGFTWNTGY